MRWSSIMKILSARSDIASLAGLHPDQRSMLACSIAYGMVAALLVAAGLSDIGVASLGTVVLQLLGAALAQSACLLCAFAGLLSGSDDGSDF